MKVSSTPAPWTAYNAASLKVGDIVMIDPLVIDESEIYPLISVFCEAKEHEGYWIGFGWITYDGRRVSLQPMISDGPVHERQHYEPIQDEL